MGKGMFPVMKPSEIILALSAWGISVSEQQLMMPTPDFVEGIYCIFLEQLTGLTPDSFRVPVQNSLSLVEYDQDLYAPALKQSMLVFHLNRFAQAARVEDFSGKDISHPDKNRTLTLLAAFINLVKFTEEWCTPFVKELRERADTMNVQREQISRELADLQHTIELMEAKIAEDEPRCEQLRKENSNIRARLFATKESQTAAVQEVEQLKAEKSALNKRKGAITDEIKSIQDTISRTRSRIVQSPERVKRTIATLTTTLAEDKKTVAMNEAKARDLQAKISALLNIEKDVRNCVEQLQTTEKEVHLLEVSQKELAELKDSLDGKQIERNELSQRQKRVANQLSNATEKLERAQRHAEDKKLTSQKTIDRLQREYDEMALERRDNDKQMEELRSEAFEIETKMAEHLKKSEAELNELLAEYWNLRHETDVYMEILANKLNMTVSSD